MATASTTFEIAAGPAATGTAFEIAAGLDSPPREMPLALRQRLSTSPKKSVSMADFESKMQRAMEVRETHLQTAAQKAAAVSEKAAAVAAKTGGGIYSDNEAKRHELLETVAAADSRRQAVLQERRARAGAHVSHASRAATVASAHATAQACRLLEAHTDSQAAAAARRQAAIAARCESAASASAAAKAKVEAARQRARVQVAVQAQSLSQSQADAAARVAEARRLQQAQLEAAAFHRAEVQARRATVPVA